MTKKLSTKNPENFFVNLMRGFTVFWQTKSKFSATNHLKQLFQTNNIKEELMR